MSNTVANPQFSTVRFIHEQDIGLKHFKAFTVAYTRNEERVFFAVTFCTNKDQFIKKIGREVSTEILNRNLDGLINTPSTETGGFATSSSKGSLIGFMDVDAMIRAFELDAMLANQTTNQLTMLDFKHAAISSVVGGFINFLCDNDLE